MKDNEIAWGSTFTQEAWSYADEETQKYIDEEYQEYIDSGGNIHMKPTPEMVKAYINMRIYELFKKEAEKNKLNND